MLLKHISIKHEVLNKEANNQKINIKSGTISDQVYACNVCNEKFDKEDIVKKKNTINSITKLFPLKTAKFISMLFQENYFRNKDFSTKHKRWLCRVWDNKGWD